MKNKTAPNIETWVFNYAKKKGLQVLLCNESTIQILFERGKPLFAKALQLTVNDAKCKNKTEFKKKIRDCINSRLKLTQAYKEKDRARKELKSIINSNDLKKYAHLFVNCEFRAFNEEKQRAVTIVAACELLHLFVNESDPLEISPWTCRILIGDLVKQGYTIRGWQN